MPRLEWSSSAPDVATVSADGIVTAVGNGAAELVARSAAVADTAAVTVRQVAASVEVGPDSLHLLTGQADGLTARAEDANGNEVRLDEIAGATFSWESMDAAVAMVSAEGGPAVQVTAVGAGETRVAASLDGVSGSTAVTVEARVPTSLALADDSLEFAALGDTERPGVTVLDQAGEELADAEVEWSSSSPEVATVSADGTVTALSNGAAEVVASSGSASGTVVVTVRQVAASVSVGPEVLHLLTGQASGVTAPSRGRERQRGEAGGDRRSLVLVGVHGSGGGGDLRQRRVRAVQVTAVGAGETRVAASLDGVSGSTAVTVEARAATKLVLAEDALAFTALGDMAQLNVVVLDQADEELAGAEVEWSSSDAAVALVSGDGTVTATANGVAEVVATSGTASDRVSVTVRQVAASVSVGPDSLHLLTGQAVGVTARVEDANGNEVRIEEIAGASFSWESADAGVAMISGDDGSAVQVTAVAEGLTRVTASLDGLSGVGGSHGGGASTH